MWGAGGSGVARQPETEMMQGCQMVGESRQLLWVCVCGGVLATLPCVVSGRGTDIFFIIDRVVVHKGFALLSLPPLLSCVRACMHGTADSLACVH
jgi:hypothetical protein